MMINYLVSNKIIGCKKRFIPIFSFEYTSLEKVKKKLIKTQQMYSLTDIFLFRTYNEIKKEPQIIALSLKSLDKRRTHKILKYAKSRNLDEYEKYGKIRFKLSDENGGMAEYLCTLPSKNKTSFISKPHYNLISKFTKMDKYKNQHGDRLEVTFCEVEER